MVAAAGTWVGEYGRVRVTQDVLPRIDGKLNGLRSKHVSDPGDAELFGVCGR